jgi:hypothetical protein
LQARTQREDLRPQRVWALRQGEHEAAIDLKAVPGIGAEIVLTVDGELRKTRLSAPTTQAELVGGSRGHARDVRGGPVGAFYVPNNASPGFGAVSFSQHRSHCKCRRYGVRSITRTSCPHAEQGGRLMRLCRRSRAISRSVAWSGCRRPSGSTGHLQRIRTAWMGSVKAPAATEQ